MLHEAQPMRQAALKCVKTIQSTCDKDLPHLNLLLKTILRAKEEIMSDAQYFPLVSKRISLSLHKLVSSKSLFSVCKRYW